MSAQQNEYSPIREGSLQAAHPQVLLTSVRAMKSPSGGEKDSHVVAGSKLHLSCSRRFLLTSGQLSLRQKSFQVSKSLTSTKRKDIHTKGFHGWGGNYPWKWYEQKRFRRYHTRFQGMPVHGSKATLDPTSDTRCINLRIKGNMRSNKHLFEIQKNAYSVSTNSGRSPNCSD